MGLLSLCNMCGCDLTFVFPHFTSRDLRRDRFRQFPEARRFDTLWANFGRSPLRLHGRRNGRFTLEDSYCLSGRGSSRHRVDDSGGHPGARSTYEQRDLALRDFAARWHGYEACRTRQPSARGGPLRAEHGGFGFVECQRSGSMS
jgi:hypothetical protein